MGGIHATNIRYADDIVLMASSDAGLQELISQLNEVASDTGMQVNVKKTKVVKVSDDPTPVSVTIRDEKAEEVHTFKYLVAIFNSDSAQTRTKRGCYKANKWWAD